MFIPPIGHFNQENWEQFSSRNHPQMDVLKKHIDRAVQDLFLDSFRSQTRDFLFIFDGEEQIGKFALRMIKYWEKEESYEVCSEIVKLKKRMINKWRKIMAEETDEGGEVKEWLKSSYQKD